MDGLKNVRNLEGDIFSSFLEKYITIEVGYQVIPFKIMKVIEIKEHPEIIHNFKKGKNSNICGSIYDNGAFIPVVGNPKIQHAAEELKSRVLITAAKCFSCRIRLGIKLTEGLTNRYLCPSFAV